MKTRLPLQEEITLLALRDREGTIASSTTYPYAVGGAVLAELLLSGRVAVDEERKKKYPRVVSREPLGDPVIDECLERVANAKKRATLQTWVTRFAGVKNLKHRVAGELCRRGILRTEEDKILLIFSRKIYPEVDPRPEHEIVERLRQAIFTDSRNVDVRTVVLLSLARAADLLKGNFDKRELKTRKERIERVVNGEATGKATREAIEAMQAAVMVAVFVPVIAAAASHSR